MTPFAARPWARSGRGSPRSFFLLLLLALAFYAGAQTRAWYLRARHAAVEPRPVAARGDLRPEEQHTIDLFENSASSVVYITSVAVQRDAFTLNLFAVPRGTGSGFVWDRAGHVVTNFHVIQEASRAEVTLSDQSTWEARLVGAEPDKDLAVLKIDAPAETLRPIPVGASADLQVGQSVYAIGNPFGLDQTLTTGVISGLGREIESVSRRPILGVIQTDAAINPGNSGGPLLDSAGRLIGINTAIYSPSGAYAGIGFAVPVDTVNRIVPQLIEFGRVQRPVLGISLLDDSVSRRLGIEGVLFWQVQAGSGAEKAGLQATGSDQRRRLVLGDVIVAVDGKPVRTADDLYRILDRHEIGAIVRVQLLRDGREFEVKVRLTGAD